MVLCNISSIFIRFVFLYILQNVPANIQQTKIDKLDCDINIRIHDLRFNNELLIHFVNELQ